MTDSDFTNDLVERCSSLLDKPKSLCWEFAEVCEPMLCKEGPMLREIFKALVLKKGPVLNLRGIPECFRGYIAVYQAWGINCGDGMEAYLSQTDEFFDRYD